MEEFPSGLAERSLLPSPPPLFDVSWELRLLLLPLPTPLLPLGAADLAFLAGLLGGAACFLYWPEYLLAASSEVWVPLFWRTWRKLSTWSLSLPTLATLMRQEDRLTVVKGRNFFFWEKSNYI